MDGQLLLLNGTAPTEGRVEMCYNNSYGSICDDKWDILDARVVCNQLNFSSQGEYYHLQCLYTNSCKLLLIFAL